MLSQRLIHVSSAVALGLTLNSGCRSVPSSQVKDAIGGTDPSGLNILSCDTGELAYFVMKEAPNPVTPDDFPVKVPDIDSPKDRLVRLDLCYDDEKLSVKRILMGYPDYADIIDVVPQSKVEGLKEALFDDDYSKLEMIVPYVNLEKWGELQPTDFAFYLKGSAKGSALATVVNKQGDTLSYADERFMNAAYAGKFEFVEPNERGNDCKSVSDTGGSSKVGTLTVEWLGKSRTGTSGGVAPDVCSIIITDSSPEMGPKAGVPVEIKIQNFEDNENFETSGNHHSVCDSFRLKTPYAQYFLTSSSSGFGGGSCTRLVNGAPQGTPEGTKFRFEYGEKVVEGLDKNCYHLLRRCAGLNRN